MEDLIYFGCERSEKRGLLSINRKKKLIVVFNQSGVMLRKKFHQIIYCTKGSELSIQFYVKAQDEPIELKLESKQDCEDCVKMCTICLGSEEDNGTLEKFSRFASTKKQVCRIKRKDWSNTYITVQNYHVLVFDGETPSKIIDCITLCLFDVEMECQYRKTVKLSRPDKTLYFQFELQREHKYWGKLFKQLRRTHGPQASPKMASPDSPSEVQVKSIIGYPSELLEPYRSRSPISPQNKSPSVSLYTRVANIPLPPSQSSENPTVNSRPSSKNRMPSPDPQKKYQRPSSSPSRVHPSRTPSYAPNIEQTYGPPPGDGRSRIPSSSSKPSKIAPPAKRGPQTLAVPHQQFEPSVTPEGLYQTGPVPPPSPKVPEMPNLPHPPGGQVPRAIPTKFASELQSLRFPKLRKSPARSQSRPRSEKGQEVGMKEYPMSVKDRRLMETNLKDSGSTFSSHDGRNTTSVSARRGQTRSNTASRHFLDASDYLYDVLVPLPVKTSQGPVTLLPGTQVKVIERKTQKRDRRVIVQLTISDPVVGTCYLYDQGRLALNNTAVRRQYSPFSWNYAMLDFHRNFSWNGKHRSTIIYWGRDHSSRRNRVVDIPSKVSSLTDCRLVSLSIPSGATHGFGISEECQLYVFGETNVAPKCNPMGLVHKTTSYKPSLLPQFGGQQVIHVCGSYRHTLVLTSDGIIYAWGSAELTGRFSDSSTPSRLQFIADHHIIGICSSEHHSCAWDMHGRLFTFGKPGPELGLGSDLHQHTHAHVSIPFGQVDKGRMRIYHIQKVVCSTHTLVLLSNGKVLAWGRNEYGQLGIGTTETVDRPRIVSSIPPCSDIAVGEEHSVFLTVKGEIYTAGGNDFRQCGHAEFRNFLQPSRLPGFHTRMVRIAAGAFHSFAISMYGCVVMWGKQPYSERTYMPFVLHDLRHWRTYQIVVGRDFIMALGVLVTSQVSSEGLPIPAPQIVDSKPRRAYRNKTRESLPKQESPLLLGPHGGEELPASPVRAPRFSYSQPRPEPRAGRSEPRAGRSKPRLSPGRARSKPRPHGSAGRSRRKPDRQSASRRHHTQELNDYSSESVPRRFAARRFDGRGPLVGSEASRSASIRRNAGKGLQFRNENVLASISQEPDDKFMISYVKFGDAKSPRTSWSLRLMANNEFKYSMDDEDEEIEVFLSGHFFKYDYKEIQQFVRGLDVVLPKRLVLLCVGFLPKCKNRLVFVVTKKEIRRRRNLERCLTYQKGNIRVYGKWSDNHFEVRKLDLSVMSEFVGPGEILRLTKESDSDFMEL